MKMNILVLCTGNSCRSQMAEAYLQSFDSGLTVSSAGTNPAKQVHPKAVEVMGETGLELDNHFPEHIDSYIDKDFDYVITVCGGANKSCPTFNGNVVNRVHIGFDDPAEATGTEEEITNEFIRIRDEIKYDFYNFYLKKIKPLL